MTDEDRSLLSLVLEGLTDQQIADRTMRTLGAVSMRHFGPHITAHWRMAQVLTGPA